MDDIEWEIAEEQNAAKPRKPGTPRKKATTPPPAPHPKPCFNGTDYGHDCPQGWTRSDKKYKRGSCKAPSTYNPPDGCDMQVGIDTVLRTPKDKYQYELKCRVKWPCYDKALDAIAQEDPDSDQPSFNWRVLRPDYSTPCPEDWAYYTDGSCRAPESYGGDCPFKWHFLGYTRSMKSMWSRICQAGWPLVQGKKPLTEDQQEIKARRKKQMRAVWSGDCPEDYYNSCPKYWKLDAKGYCHAPDGVAAPVPPGKARRAEFVKGDTSLCPQVFSTHRMSRDMKKALEKHCGVKWPCHGEVVLEHALPSPLLIVGLELGLAFL